MGSEEPISSFADEKFCSLFDPELFVKEFILPKQVGSSERNRIISLLKRINPEY